MLEPIFLGTYTKRSSQGLYRIYLNHETKQLQDLELIAAIENPTYLASNPSTQTLIAVSKVDGHGGIQVLGPDFALLAHAHHEKAVPCYVSYDEVAGEIYSANYHEGSFSHYSYNQGQLDLKERLFHVGQEGQVSHVHYSQTSPDGNWLFVCDLGLDQVVTYAESEEGLSRVSTYETQAGAGPRHLAFHPSLPLVFLINELDASLEVLSYDASSGKLSSLNRYPLTQEGQQAWGGAVRVSPDGRHVYATNRGYDRIYAFALGQDGQSLSPIADYPTYGSVARDFNFNQSGDFLIIGHQETDTLTLYQRDQESGQLSLLQKDVFGPEVVCVQPGF